MVSAIRPGSTTPWQRYIEDDRIRDTMARVLDGFEEFNTRARHPHGFPRRAAGSNDDRYRRLNGLRTVIFMNDGDMRERGLGQFDLVDVRSLSRDGSPRADMRPSSPTTAQAQ